MTKSFAANLNSLTTKALAEIRQNKKREREQKELALREEKVRLRAEFQAKKLAEKESIRLQKIEKNRIESINKQQKLIEREKKIQENKFRSYISKFYLKLAVAGWDGKDFVYINEFLDESAVKRISDSGIKCCKAVDDSKELDAQGEYSNCIRQAKNISRFLGYLNSKKLSIEFDAEIEKIEAVGILKRYRNMRLNIEKVMRGLESRVKREQLSKSNNLINIAKVESQIKSLELLIAAKKEELVKLNSDADGYVKGVNFLAERISPFVAQVGINFKVLSEKFPSESIDEKARLLRLACSNYIFDVDFGNFSNLQMINAFRILNKLDPINAFGGSSTSSLLGESREIEKKIEQAQARLNLSFDNLRHLINNQSSALGACENLIDKLRQFSDCIDSLNEKLLMLDGSILFRNGNYYSKMKISVGEFDSRSEAELYPAYQELVWLHSNNGLEFCRNFDSQLTKVAKSGKMAVTIIVSAEDCFNSVAFDNNFLKMAIGVELFLLLLIERGFQVRELNRRGEILVFEIRW